MSRTAYGVLLMVVTGIGLLYALLSPARDPETRLGTCALLGAVFLVSFWAVVAEVAPGLFHSGGRVVVVRTTRRRARRKGRSRGGNFPAGRVVMIGVGAVLVVGLVAGVMIFKKVRWADPDNTARPTPPPMPTQPPKTAIMPQPGTPDEVTQPRPQGGYGLTK